MCQFIVGIPVLSNELCTSIDIKNALSVSIKWDFWKRLRGWWRCWGWVDVEVGTEVVEVIMEVIVMDVAVAAKVEVLVEEELVVVVEGVVCWARVVVVGVGQWLITLTLGGRYIMI